MVVELYETNNIGKLQLVKSLLRINEIEHEVFNEKILQTGSLEAMGIQGAIVKVDSQDYNLAKELLIENELMFPSKEEGIPESMKWLDEKLDISFLKGKPAYVKLLVLAGCILFLLGALVFSLIANGIIN